MKILSPIDKVDEVEEVIKAGADELYCGVLLRDWLSKYTIAAVNRRPAGIANLKSFDELKNCVDIAHSYSVPVCLTINEHYYTQEQYPLLFGYVEAAINAGTDSFLISDPALILALREKNLKIAIHVSTGGVTFNAETARFYQSLGALRITIPRHLTIREIAELVKKSPGIEKCVFILNSRCPNEDGLCTFMHIQSGDPSYQNACLLPYSVRLLTPESGDTEFDEAKTKREIVSCVRQLVWSRFHMDDVPCGACALYEFAEMGIEAVKIVGRGNPTWRKVTDVRFIRLLLGILRDKSVSREAYREQAQGLYGHIYQRPCRTALCYYPEVMSPEVQVN